MISMNKEQLNLIKISSLSNNSYRVLEDNLMIGIFITLLNNKGSKLNDIIFIELYKN